MIYFFEFKNGEINMKRDTLYRIFNLTNWIFFIISLLVGAFIILFYCLFYSWTIYEAMNATFIAGGFLICCSLLYFCALCGLFDIFAVGFSNLVNVRRKEFHNKTTLFDYQQTKATSRSKHKFSWLFILLAGLVFLVISVILYIYFINYIR